MLNHFEEQVCLQPYNTFRICAYAQYFLRLTSWDTLIKLKKEGVYRAAPFYLGQGSNTILSDLVLTRPIIKNELKGIRWLSADKDTVCVEVAAGESWDEWVRYTLTKGWFGLENLSLIPGTVGAAPIQNIGAYGVEVSSCIDSVVCADLSDPKNRTLILSHHDCCFSYRNSLFKTTAGQTLFVIAVRFRLTTCPKTTTAYGEIRQQLQKMGIASRSPTPFEVAEAIITLRRQVLPDPAQFGNAGSFFKNPVVSSQHAHTLLKTYPHLPTYPLENNQIKLAAGWLIEQAGLKGYRVGDAAVHQDHALILINKGQASGQDVGKLTRYIQEVVAQRYGIVLEPEPVFLTNA
ncbi:MAG: UDP-N-acetylmuramate dehydrogenase [Neisseriales bacterium]|nr:MAG: UDP-N-acetylmuramate dehydrogenase [Neisseriales bacterium]